MQDIKAQSSGTLEPLWTLEVSLCGEETGLKDELSEILLQVDGRTRTYYHTS